jgi:hypothetical protein
VNTKRNIVIVLLGLAFAASGIASASAASPHPRRAQVNHRLAIQNARIHHNLAAGNITPQQAAQLHSDVHGVRVLERTDASLHNGRITKAQQRALNQNENAISRQIYQDAH